MLQASVSDPENVFLSISTPSLSHEAAAPSSSSAASRLPELTLQETRKTYGRFAEIVEPPREGYALTLKLNFSGLARPKGTLRRTHQR
jgi:actin related protein 2/3 complex subunit 2